VNRKHVHRLWRHAKLQVRKVARKRRPARAASVPVQATHPGHVWTYDFLYDRCLKGTPLKVLTVIDEFTREGLAIEVATALPSQRVLTVLERLVATHSAPEFIRSDHRPEFIVLAIRGWLAQHQTRTLSIDPGCPWQHGYGGSFNGTVRDECLKMSVFHAVAEARVMLAT
jgi:putative transposase